MFTGIGVYLVNETKEKSCGRWLIKEEARLVLKRPSIEQNRAPHHFAPKEPDKVTHFFWMLIEIKSTLIFDVCEIFFESQLRYRHFCISTLEFPRINFQCKHEGLIDLLASLGLSECHWCPK